jgi:hypothetical protein
MYRNASKSVLKNCVAATGEVEINLSKAISSIGSTISLLGVSNVAEHFSIHERNPLSVAGNAVLEEDFCANLIAKRWFLSSNDAVTNKNPVPNLKII